MAKPLTFKDLVDAINTSDKETIQSGGKVRETAARAKIKSLAESMGESVPASGIITRKLKGEGGESAAITKAVAGDIRGLKNITQLLLKEAKETNKGIAALTDITVAGNKDTQEFVETNSKFIESNQELINRLMQDFAMNKKEQSDGAGGEGRGQVEKKKDEGMSSTGLGLMGAAIAGILPFLGDLKEWVEKSGMWILEIPNTIKNSIIFGMNRVASSLSKALEPVENLTSIVRRTLFPSAVDNPPKGRTPAGTSPDVDGKAPQTPEPDGKAPAADDAAKGKKPSVTPDTPDRAPSITPDDVTPPAAKPTPTGPRGTAGSAAAAGSAAGAAKEGAEKGAEKLVKKKFGTSLAKYVGAKLLQKSLKLVPVAGAGLALWDGLAAFSVGDWHRVASNGAMGLGSLLEATGIGSGLGVGVGTLGLADSILHDIYSELYTNQDGSPADYAYDLVNNNALAQERLKDIIPVVKDQVTQFASESMDSLTAPVKEFFSQPLKPFTNNPRGAGARMVQPKDTSGEYNGEITAEEAYRSTMSLRGSSPSHRTPLPPTPAPRLNQQQLNNIAAPVGQQAPNVIINKQGDVINQVTNNRGGAGGGASGASGSPSRVPSPFDYLLYGDSFNWGN